MLKRPLILKLFSILLFIDPLLRISFISIETDFSVWLVITKTFALGFKDFINFWFLFPLSGFFLLSVKVYSYLFFIAVQLYSFYFHLNYEPYSWPYISEHPSTSAYILLCINLGMVIYLLLPKSRELFFNKDLRWWERGSRYTINKPCTARVEDREYHGHLIDLSFGGALLTFKETLDIDKPIRLAFYVLGRKVNIEAQVVRAMEELDGKLNYGIQFQFKNGFERYKLKFFMFIISKVTKYEKYR